jgi:hypothetical protein
VAGTRRKPSSSAVESPGYANDPRLVAKLRRSPEARLRWLLQFSQADAVKSDTDFRKTFEVLMYFQGGAFWGNHPISGDKCARVLEVQRHLRQLFIEMANGRPFHFDAPSSFWAFTPPPPRSSGARVSARIDRLHSQKVMRGELPAAVVFKTIDLLDEVGADRLKACPLVVAGETCGTIFLARGRKTYCKPQHAQKAANVKYWKTGGEEKRKLNRKD